MGGTIENLGEDGSGCHFHDANHWLDIISHHVLLLFFIKKHPHPQYNSYLNEKKFKKFKIEFGNIVWGKNWDLIFPIDKLYAGVCC